MSMKSKRDRWIDLDSLPHKKSLVDWKASVGKTVAFKYDDIEGVVTFVKWHNNGEISLLYNGEEYRFKRSHIKRVPFGIMLGKSHYDWHYEEGQHICNKGSGGSAVIKKRFIKATSSSSVSRFYSLLCDSCGQLYEKIENEVESRGCPVCHNDIVIKGVNDLWATHPHIAQQLKNPEDGYNVTYGQRKYFDWICPFCGEEIKHKTPMYVINAKNECVSCEKCSDPYSFPNKFFFNLLREINVEFEVEKNFNWNGLGLRRYDFYIPEHDMIVEIHGGQHYDSRFPWIKENDIEKRQIALKNGISKYIEIDARRSNGNYIFKNIKNQLDSYFDFSYVNVDKISLQASKKIFDLVLELLEQYNYDEKIVSEILIIDRTTISRYLNSAIRSGVLNEELVRKKQLSNKIDKHYQLNGKPIRNKETGEVFGNYTQLKNWFVNRGIATFSAGTLSSSLKRVNGSAYGYHWEHISREEFNRIKEMNPELAYGDYFENIAS